MKLQQERSALDRSESDLTVQTLREQNTLMQQELEDAQKELARLQASQLPTYDDEERELREEKLASMQRSLDDLTRQAEEKLVVDAGVATASSSGDEQLRSENEVLRRRLEQLEAQNVAMTTAVETATDEAETDPQSLPDKHRQLAAMHARLKQDAVTRAAEFTALKTALLLDLQDRCEKAVDLELLLEEARDQYQKLLERSGPKAQKTAQKRITLLQKHLQTAALKHREAESVFKREMIEKQVVMKRLAGREERTKKLEKRLEEERLEHEKQLEQLEASLDKVKTELAAVRAAPRSPMSARRVAMPMRGGQSRHRSNSVKSEEGGDGSSKPGFWNRFRSSKKVAMPMRGKGAAKPSSPAAAQQQ
jgi:kinesin family member 5